MDSPITIHESPVASKLLMISVMIFLTSCLGQRDLQVGYDYNYKSDFRGYKTFDLMQATLESDSSSNNEIIRKAIVSRMEFLGYEQGSTHPNLIVSAKLFTDSVRLSTYAQPSLEQWLKSPCDNITDRPSRYIVKLKPGTLLIQFFDPKQKQTVWQGYSSMPFGVVDYNDKQLRRAVFSILDQYKIWAHGFIDQRFLVLPKKSNRDLKMMHSTAHE